MKEISFWGGNSPIKYSIEIHDKLEPEMFSVGIFAKVYYENNEDVIHIGDMEQVLKCLSHSLESYREIENDEEEVYLTKKELKRFIDSFKKLAEQEQFYEEIMKEYKDIIVSMEGSR